MLQDIISCFSVCHFVSASTFWVLDIVAKVENNYMLALFYAWCLVKYLWYYIYMYIVSRIYFIHEGISVWNKLLGDRKAVFIQAKSQAFYLKCVNSKCFVPGLFGIDVFWNLPLKTSQHVWLGYFAMWKTVLRDYLFISGTVSFSPGFSNRTSHGLFSPWICFSDPSSWLRTPSHWFADALSVSAHPGLRLRLPFISCQLHVLSWASSNPPVLGLLGGW